MNFSYSDTINTFLADSTTLKIDGLFLKIFGGMYRAAFTYDSTDIQSNAVAFSPNYRITCDPRSILIQHQLNSPISIASTLKSGSLEEAVRFCNQIISYFNFHAITFLILDHKSPDTFLKRARTSDYHFFSSLLDWAVKKSAREIFGSNWLTNWMSARERNVVHTLRNNWSTPKYFFDDYPSTTPNNICRKSDLILDTAFHHVSDQLTYKLFKKYRLGKPGLMANDHRRIFCWWPMGYFFQQNSYLLNSSPRDAMHFIDQVAERFNNLVRKSGLSAWWNSDTNSIYWLTGYGMTGVKMIELRNAAFNAVGRATFRKSWVDISPLQCP